MSNTPLADLYTGRKLSRVRRFLERELIRLSRVSTPTPSTGSQAAPASNSPPPMSDLDLVEFVGARPEGEGIALTYVTQGRTVSLLLPRHRAARLLGELAQAMA